MVTNFADALKTPDGSVRIEVSCLQKDAFISFKVMEPAAGCSEHSQSDGVRSG